jgi:hypothetical protein
MQLSVQPTFFPSHNTSICTFHSILLPATNVPVDAKSRHSNAASLIFERDRDEWKSCLYAALNVDESVVDGDRNRQTE